MRMNCLRNYCGCCRRNEDEDEITTREEIIQLTTVFNYILNHIRRNINNGEYDNLIFIEIDFMRRVLLDVEDFLESENILTIQQGIIEALPEIIEEERIKRRKKLFGSRPNKHLKSAAAKIKQE